jgi:hypothetical protein
MKLQKRPGNFSFRHIILLWLYRGTCGYSWIIRTALCHRRNQDNTNAGWLQTAPVRVVTLLRGVDKALQTVNMENIDIEKYTPHRGRQVRKKPIDRRPRYYWCDSTNLRNELTLFWTQLGIDTNHSSPTIPNESLLVYYDRHDIRAAIVKNGGRLAVSSLLNHAPIMPGRWRDAVSTSTELQQLIQIEATALRTDRPPWTNKSTIQLTSVDATTKLWSHQSGRNQKGYWNLQTVIQELYVYHKIYTLPIQLAHHVHGKGLLS